MQWVVGDAWINECTVPGYDPSPLRRLQLPVITSHKCYQYWSSCRALMVMLVSITVLWRKSFIIYSSLPSNTMIGSHFDWAKGGLEPSMLGMTLAFQMGLTAQPVYQ